ncbi:DUF3667 domain-containing protein [Christiangramia flava]|uniref:Uncharacterized protein n=1 Tax=Christiangramia flava JLT2011 TaxID=1229726 RepID=A0A1L7I8V1_9FLAO|nr:DUF3667 domain-containing protein [Christiangramia flava]APU69535.1 hypothetical protein GRFL_2811 [Christiangramia flava JLT2011]OSS37861.1 hypothetical protein C723_3140 [Christiangramia flava JLT2011]
MNICKNCQNKFSGNYCNNCGEKIISDEDFSITNILSQAVGAITNFDSKLLRTFQIMGNNPGILSSKIVSGIRVPFLKPFQIFVICNVLFFIFLSDTDLFRTPAKWFFNENFQYFGTTVIDKVSIIMRKENLSFTEVQSKYDSISSNLSKSLLIILIPFIASIGIMIKRNLQFGKHLILATIYFSQLLLCTTILYLITTNLPVPNKWFFTVPAVLVAIAYYVLSIKKFYNKSLLFSIAFGIFGIFLIGIFINFYRSLINIISLSLL